MKQSALRAVVLALALTGLATALAGCVYYPYGGPGYYGGGYYHGGWHHDDDDR
ncbi:MULTISPECIES: hypothetical protein [Acidiphilium]|jgi:hypothetical protein|uniref:Uncharacterized protein n=1 Tax=Acidiphilium multivorum (strain DSM 11245 / JCM 8867 / NBRC 100883 / AIU 301) TaxID=926570 RepID=F0J3Z4_ACIMA|nr:MULTISPECIES: hypothetical protein [Acidiphilium]MBU6357582.1 hypothetical protein [Rhodospirillales bacterium]KDM66214.1 hypothetical protein ACIDI_65c00100 [Acidiphilium sp. JA12-A1]MBS3025265.1 hypothetical protein [Acidiphilium multivorum]MDE2328132.1 hypothetical protein [Rhodospirillales bacterium]BAJ82135.1 hypothetical protein ACMV_27880 [Acidiphilium multivorum AIU301]